MKHFVKYFYACGVIAHVLLAVLLMWQPFLIEKGASLITNKYYSWQKKQALEQLTKGKSLSLEQEIQRTLPPWQALTAKVIMQGEALINQVSYSTLGAAVSALNDGDSLTIAQGVYTQPIVLNKNNITIKGNGHVVFKSGSAQGKAFIVNKGDNVTVVNIECKNIQVRDGNGACIRQEGSNLTLEHVYFHDAQQGVLESSSKASVIEIKDSRFERLGFNGQAHGIYTNKARVFIDKSIFVASKDEGHAIKVRGNQLVIDDSIIMSLSSDDSRLIDMPNGGELMISRSLLAQGPKSVNGQVIGFGLEGYRYINNGITFTDNMFLLERIGSNYLLAVDEKKEVALKQSNNIIVGHDKSTFFNKANRYVENREALNMKIYPYLPTLFCQTSSLCPINTNSR